MNEPDEGRPGGPATPPSADPAPPAASAGSGATGDDTVIETPTAAAEPAPPTPAPAPAPTPTAPAPPATVSAPTPAPAPATAPVTAAVAPSGPSYAPTGALDDDIAYDLEDLDDDDLDDLDTLDSPRWVGLATTAGAGIIGVVALQVLMALVEGLSIKDSQRFGVTDDLLHRLGYPFGSLGSTAVFFVVLGILLISLPAILGEGVNDRQYSIAGAALRTAIAVGVIIALGSLLAVRGSLHEYSAKNVAVPGYVRIQFTGFLLATLAGAALAIFSAITALARPRRRLTVPGDRRGAAP